MRLARSGDCVPLDIAIVMDGNFMDGISIFEDPKCAVRARSALEFIVAHGGATSRWETLTIWSDMPRVMKAILDFIYNARLDNLHTLKLHNHGANMHVGDKLVAEALVGQDSSRSVIFKTQPPLLYDIQLLNIPELLVQHRSTPLVCNLTSLDLVAMVSLPPLTTLYKLLLHSPRLELLNLCTKLVKNINSLYLAPTAPRVNMPHLRQFTLNEPASVSWGLSVLKMVDAPGLEMFSLGLSHFINLGTILSYIAFGRSSGQLVDDHSGLSEHIVGIDGAAIYPALEHLTITRMPYPPKSIIHVLKAFQNITRLDWEVGMNSDAELCTVLAESAVCSQLEHLRIYQVPAELEILARQRAEQGQPLLIVEVSSVAWEQASEIIRQKLESSVETIWTYDDPKDHLDGDMD